MNTDAPQVELGRRYHFAASHRLHSPHLSVSGEIDPATGMIANLADLDAFVGHQVLEEFDHRSLNEDVAAFRDKVPTTENLCIEIFDRLKHFPHAKLERVRIQETANNSF